MALGVDIGGTFTDVVLVRSSGELRTAKVLTTPHQPEQAVLDGIRKLLTEAGVGAALFGLVLPATGCWSPRASKPRFRPCRRPDNQHGRHSRYPGYAPLVCRAPCAK